MPSERTRSGVTVAMAPIHMERKMAEPPVSGYYSGKVLHVGGFGPGNYTSIQSALDDAEDRDQVWLYSGTYSEVLTVTDEVWIKAAAGTKLMNPGGANEGITMNTNNVTVTGLNITDFHYGIYSTFSGHNITRNSLWMNEYAIVFRDIVKNLDHDHNNYGYVIRDNDITQISDRYAIEVDINLDFDMGGPYTFDVDDVIVAGNDILVLNNAPVVASFYLSLTDIGKGSGSIGDHRFIDNDMEGGRGGIEFSGDMRQLRDLDLVVGDIELVSNTVVEYSNFGIWVHYFNIQMITGNTTLGFGDIIISQNQVGSSIPSARGIVFDYLYYIISMREASTIEYGELLIKKNTIDTQGIGISAYSPDPGYEIFDNCSVSIGKNSISDNRILNGQIGIYYSFSNLHNHFGSTFFEFSGLVIEGNSIRSATQSIELHLSRVGFALSADAHVEMGEIKVRDNSMVSGSTGIHLSMDVIGNGMAGTSTFSWDGLNISENMIQGVTGVDVHAFTDVADQLYNQTISRIGNISFYRNSILTTGTGIHFDELNNFGSVLFGEARAEVGEISLSDNVFDCGGLGIHFTGFNQFGSLLRDNSTFVFKGFNIGSNDIISDSNGIQIERMMGFANYLYNYSSAMVGDLQFNGNTVRSNQSGIRIGNIEHFGNYLFERSSMVLGDIEISGNDIICNETGILLQSFSMNGYMLFTVASAYIGDVSIVGNKIVSRLSTGVNFGQYMNNGYLLRDNATVSLGKLKISQNNITSEYSGLLFMAYGYLAYVLYNYSAVDVGALEIIMNQINSRGEGVAILGLYYVGYILNHDTRAEYGGVNISRNLLTSYAKGLYISNLGGMGYAMRDRSRSDAGPVRLDENIIKTNGNAIQIDMMYGFGYDITGNAEAELEGFSLSGNIIDAGGRGIWIGGFTNVNMQVEGGAASSIGNFTIASNVINSAEGGVHFESIGYLNSALKANARVQMGAFKVFKNEITAGKDHGLAFMSMSLWGSGNIDTTFARMDGFDISENRFSSPDTSLILEFRQLGGYMEGDARFELGPINIENNDLVSDRIGIEIDFKGLSDNMIGAAMIRVEGVDVSGNRIDAEDGIYLPIEIGIPSMKSEVLFGDVEVSENVIEHTMNYSLFIPVNTNILDDVRVELGDMHLLWNEIKGSDTWGIRLYDQIITTSSILPKLGDVELMGNSIENCADGLYLNHTKNVTAYANNFIKNVDDTVIEDTTIRWVSRQPIWYRHGMRNFSSYLGNYWDRYTGWDSNDDGIGDTPYNTGFGMDTHPLMSRIEDHLPPWNDEIPPEMVITSPLNGTAFNLTTVKMTWVGTDDLLGIERYEVRLDDGEWKLVGLSLSYTFTDLEEGRHDLLVKGVDRAGNERVVSISVIIDISEPWLVILEPADGVFINTSQVLVSWEMVDDVSGIAGSMVKLDNGSWITSGKHTGFLFTNLTQGDHFVEVKVSDNAGNFLVKRIDLGVDLTPPTLSILYPSEGLLVASTSLNAEWEGSDGFSGISEFMVRMDNGTWFSRENATEHMFLNLSEGQHFLSVMVFDNSGNHIEAFVGFEIGSVEQVLSILEPLDGSYIANSTVQVVWEAFGTTYAPMIYQIRVGAGEWEDLPVIHSHTLIGLSDGSQTVHLKLTDKGGNVETASVTFILDTVAPTVVSFSHSGDRAPPGDPIIILFSESMDPGLFIIEVNDMRLPGNLSLDGEELIISPDLGPGIDVTVDIKGSDLAGNLLLEQYTFKTASKGMIMGTVIYADGKPVSKARILLDTNEEVKTDNNGDFSLEATPGMRTVSIYDEAGHKLTEFDVEVVAGKTVTPTDHLTVERHEEPTGSFWWIWLIIAIVLIAVMMGTIAFFVLKRQKGEKEEEEEEYSWDEDEGDYDDEEYDEDWDGYEE